MDDLARQVASLRVRLRLQMLVVTGAIVIGLFALGGADVVARTLIESPSWTVRTKKADLVNYADRIIATTDVDKATVKINDANLVMTGTLTATTGNIVLAQQTTAQLPSGAAPGTIAYDSTTGTLKYYNGSAWVASGGGGSLGSSIVENDAFRLVYANGTSLSLVGIGRNGGTVNIDGVLYGFATTLTQSLTPTAGITYYAYASATGGVVSLSLSQTAPTINQYGVYATMSGAGNTGFRYVGMAYASGTSFTSDMVRSVKNEQGYALTTKWTPASNPPAMPNTNWTDLNSSLARTGLFFDAERLRVWTSVTLYNPNSFTTLTSHLGVALDTNLSVADDSETYAVTNRGTAWAAAWVPQVAQTYVTTSGAGVKTVKTVVKADSGSSAQYLVGVGSPALVGFEIVR